MNRRGFLRALAVGVPIVVAPAALAELIVPKRTIFLPPRGGWSVRMLSSEGDVREFLGPEVATGEALDQVAGVKFVVRKPGEPDAEFRTRVFATPVTFTLTVPGLPTPLHGYAIDEPGEWLAYGR